MMKPTFNILVTDHTLIEWLAALFLNSVGGPIRKNRVRVDIEWRRRPSWAHNPTIRLSVPSYELENSVLNLYSFPASIKRDFRLADLNIEFDGGLLIVDLGNQKLWQRHINRSQMPAEIWNDKLLNAIEDHLYRVGIGNPTRIWGVELLNQIHGVKLVLGIKSSSDSVPTAYIKKYLPIKPPADIVVHEVNPDNWLHLDASYPPEVIADSLVTIGQKLRGNAGYAS